MKPSEKPAMRRKRNTLKTLAASGVAIGSTLDTKTWVKPLVQSVILPAHAQTSSPFTSISDPCFLRVVCRESDIQARATGQVEGSGDVSGIAIAIEFRVGSATVNRQTTSGSDGSWGPVFATFNATQGIVVATVSSPDVLFTPESCQASFDCSSDQAATCSDQWDKSSFSPANDSGSINCVSHTAEFCNGDGSEAALCPVDYDVYYSSSTTGQPPRKNSANLVFQGQVTDVPIQPGDCRTIDFSAIVGEHGDGRYEVVVHQHPEHPGTGLVPLGDCIVTGST